MTVRHISWQQIAVAEDRDGATPAHGCIALLLLLACTHYATPMPPRGSQVQSRVRKRSNNWAVRIADTVLDSTLRAVQECTKLATPNFVYHMDKPEERASLISALWADDMIHPRIHGYACGCLLV